MWFFRNCCPRVQKSYTSTGLVLITSLSEALAWPQVPSHAEFCGKQQRVWFPEIVAYESRKATRPQVLSWQQSLSEVLAFQVEVTTTSERHRHAAYGPLGTDLRRLSHNLVTDAEKLAVRAFLGGPFVVHDAH